MKHEVQNPVKKNPDFLQTSKFLPGWPSPTLSLVKRKWPTGRDPRAIGMPLEVITKAEVKKERLWDDSTQSCLVLLQFAQQIALSGLSCLFGWLDYLELVVDVLYTMVVLKTLPLLISFGPMRHRLRLAWRGSKRPRWWRHTEMKQSIPSLHLISKEYDYAVQRVLDYPWNAKTARFLSLFISHTSLCMGLSHACVRVSMVLHLTLLIGIFWVAVLLKTHQECKMSKQIYICW